MKRKRFYKNKNRNRKWTEAETGRPISFADKYDNEGAGENKFGRKPEKAFSAANLLKLDRRKRIALIAVCSIFLILIGFIGTDAYMIRHAAPLDRFNNQVKENKYDPMSEIELSFTADVVPSISLDGSVMLSSVINETQKSGHSAVVFDAKRKDGTVGYASLLNTVSSLGVMSSQGTKPVPSVKQLGENDILTVARLYTYLDNSVPSKSNDMAMKKGKKLYRDSEGNTYLNPESEIVYVYIRDIVSELYSYGINVFILDGCTVQGKDYFEELSAKLTKDVGEKIKFLEAEDVTLKGYDAESGDINSAGIKNDISKFPKLDENRIYVISTKLDENRYSSILTKENISTYVIEDIS